MWNFAKKIEISLLKKKYISVPMYLIFAQKIKKRNCRRAPKPYVHIAAQTCSGGALKKKKGSGSSFHLQWSSVPMYIHTYLPKLPMHLRASGHLAPQKMSKSSHNKMHTEIRLTMKRTLATPRNYALFPFGFDLIFFFILRHSNYLCTYLIPGQRQAK